MHEALADRRIESQKSELLRIPCAIPKIFNLSAFLP